MGAENRPSLFLALDWTIIMCCSHWSLDAKHAGRFALAWILVINEF